jgi:hypothetical protein
MDADAQDGVYSQGFTGGFVSSLASRRIFMPSKKIRDQHHVVKYHV